MELIWTLVAFILTLFVFSYLLGDNLLFRLTAYLFVGVSAGVLAIMVIDQVLVPRLFNVFLSGDGRRIILVLPALVLGLLLFFKLSPRLSPIGSVSMAYLVGAGAAVIIGGAIFGTLFGQIGATFHLATGAPTGTPAWVRVLEGVLLVVGTATTLAYFNFGAVNRPAEAPRRTVIVGWLSRIGQVFLAITLGGLFAGVFAAALSALVERLDFLSTTILSFFTK
jgi:hypothetical protein